ncbi:MAG TPA: ribosome small subunit-dependent GTPase A, partial [Burkholderiaceae bacterium]
MLTLDFALLRPIGLNQTLAAQLAPLSTQFETGAFVRVIEVQRDRCTVHNGASACEAQLLPALLRDDGPPVVGDWAVLQRDEHGGAWLLARAPAVTVIARRANDGRRQPLAANVDTALLVMGLDHDFNPRRLERYIALVQACDVAPVVVLTKRDIGIDCEERIAQLRARLPVSVPLVAVNGLAAEAADELAPWLSHGQTLVLLGASGTGKSTLTNTLTAAGQATGGIRAGDGRGRHTTTARSLHLCPQGACIIDTPGLRTWQPDADEDTLAATFDDIAALAQQCSFRDCRHEAEPGCAVRGAID